MPTVKTTLPDWHVASIDEIGLPIAEIIRQVIAAAIREVPGNRWDKTGRLVDGLRIERQSDGTWAVMPPSDRLQSEELMARLIADVPLIANPLAHPQVQAAIAAALGRAVAAG